MRAVLCFLLAFLMATGAATAASRESFDYYFVIDTSGSMAGRPAGSGNANIMPRVKQAVNEFIDKLSLGSRVAVLPFDQKVHDAKWMSLTREEERGALKSFVSAFDPIGPRTCIYAALLQALGWMQKARSQSRGVRCLSTFLLYTDGLNDCDDPSTLRQVLERFRQLRTENDHLFYTTLGVELPRAERELLESTPGVHYVAEPRGQLEPISLVEARPVALNFGEFERGASTTRHLALSFNEHLKGQTVTVSLEMADLAEHEAVRLRPEQFQLDGTDVAFTLELINPETFRQREFSGELKLRPAQGRLHVTPYNIPVSFSTLPPRSYDVTSPSPIPANLGELAFSPEGAIRAEARFLLQPSASVRSEETTLSAEVLLDPANPRALATGRQVRLSAGEQQGRRLDLGPDDRGFSLTVDLRKDAVEPGTYKGDIVLSSDGASVRGPGLVAVPGADRVSKIPFSFSVPGERMVVISVARGLPLDLGSAVVEHIAPGAPATLEQPVMVRFSPDAAAKGATVRADLELLPGNPSALEPGKDVLLAAGPGQGPSVTLDPQLDRLLVRALVPGTATPGLYKGRVTFWSKGADLAGQGLEPVAQSARALAFQFEIDVEKRLTVTLDGWQPALGDLAPASPGTHQVKKLKLGWSKSAVKAGAAVRAILKWEGKANLGALRAGTQSGLEVKLTPDHDALTLTLSPPDSLGVGNYSGLLEFQGEGCSVVGPELAAAASAGAGPALTLTARVPRPTWVYAAIVGALLLLLGVWGYSASLPRFSSWARLAIEAGPGSPGSYYLRGYQGRFSTEITVGGRGAAQVALEGLVGRAFTLRVAGGNRYLIVASMPLELRLPDSGDESLAPGRSRALPHGTTVRLGELELLFSDRS